MLGGLVLCEVEGAGWSVPAYAAPLPAVRASAAAHATISLLILVKVIVPLGVE